MKFQKISRHIFAILTKDTKSEWFMINKYDQLFFKKGIFKGKSIDDVLELYEDYDNLDNFFEYLQYLYDEETNWKDKKNIYEIYQYIKNKKIK